MDSNIEMGKKIGCGASNGVELLSHIQSCSQTSESSAFNFVYQRRRSSKDPASLPCVPVSQTLSPDNNIAFVYERRKHHRTAVNTFPAMFSANSSCDGDRSSPVIRLGIPLCGITRGPNEREGTRVSLRDQPLTTSETINGCVTEDHGFDVKEKANKTDEWYSVDDSCSSSMVDMDNGSCPIKINDTDECSSSGALVVDVMENEQSLSVNGFCVSILRSHGLLSNSGSNGSGASEEDAPSSSGSSSRSCNVCGLIGTATDMLICDECEESFHISCFNPSIGNIPTDDWYCQPCSKKKHNLLKERAVRKSSIIRTGKGSVTCGGGDFSPIALMLKDYQPYVTSVRVGKGFQAIVPEWCGPVTRGLSGFPEPVELNQSHSVNLLGPISGKHHKSFIGNWVQCREVIIGMRDSIDGTICGKWRRAPLFEVQTDNWDCFRCILWDPSHADCSVPQELETEEILKQLKYIEMLRPRLAAKRRKLEENCNASGSGVPTEDASKCTGSIDAGRNS